MAQIFVALPVPSAPTHALSRIRLQVVTRLSTCCLLSLVSCFTQSSPQINWNIDPWALSIETVLSLNGFQSLLRHCLVCAVSRVWVLKFTFWWCPVLPARKTRKKLDAKNHSCIEYPSPATTATAMTPSRYAYSLFEPPAERSVPVLTWSTTPLLTDNMNSLLCIHLATATS